MDPNIQLKSFETFSALKGDLLARKITFEATGSVADPNDLNFRANLRQQLAKQMQISPDRIVDLEIQILPGTGIGRGKGTGRVREGGGGG